MNVCQFENDLSYVNLLYRKIIHSKQLPVDKCKFFAKQFCLKYHKFIVGLVGVKESIWCVKKDHAFFTVSELKNVTTATFTDFRIEMKEAKTTYILGIQPGIGHKQIFMMERLAFLGYRGYRRSETARDLGDRFKQNNHYFKGAPC